MSRRTEIYVLVALFAVLGVVVYRMNQSSTATGGGGAQAFDGKFQPLDIQAPQLHLDQLARLKKLEYTGSHRNIFVAAPPPPPPKPLDRNPSRLGSSDRGNLRRLRRSRYRRYFSATRRGRKAAGGWLSSRAGTTC
jgi:hypothetical protein